MSDKRHRSLQTNLPFPVILFDGVCNFCNYWVNFIIAHDKQKKYRFASLQSEVGERLLLTYGVPNNLDSVVLIKDGRYYSESSAVLHIAKGLDWWRVFYFFIVVPRPLRDFVYQRVAEHRYRLSGKQDACMVPTKDIRERFLDL